MDTRNARLVSRWLMGLLYCIAGVLHFVFPAAYAHVIPPFFPAPYALVIISGVAEIAGGVGVLTTRWRRAAGFGLILLLIAVFPANLYMWFQQVSAHGWNLVTVLLLLRLPLQFVLIAWVVKTTLTA